MRVLVAAAIGVVALAAGVMLGYALGSRDDGPTTDTSQGSLPSAVEEIRAALLAAAESGDYEALRPFIPTKGGFTYTFGGPVDGGPLAYWRQLEQNTPERPLETLAAVLRMPYTLSRGYYFWPFAYDIADVDDLSPHERALLEPLGPLDKLLVEGTGYLGWRAGIAPDGTWVLFVAGD